LLSIINTGQLLKVLRGDALNMNKKLAFHLS
jgi:hypothetical protein